MATASAGEVYRDILEWGATLPLWQQELLRRVLPERDLTVAQIEELAAAAVSESEQQPSAYAPLSLADLPATASVLDARVLLGISKVRSVNALRSDQHLTFGPQLTIVYGDNGSGKSGYARVLKKVYRARVVDDILGNLGSEQPSLDPCAATFSTKGADGAAVLAEWLDGKPLENVGRFAVLDTACAGTYLRGGALAVGPSGIDVPRRFTEELDRVKNHIVRLMAASAPNKTALQRFENDTEAGRFVKGLSSATADATVAAFETWTEDDAQKLRESERAIAEGKAQAPSARRAQMRARLRALESIHSRLTMWRDAVNDTAIAADLTAVKALDEADAVLRAVQTVEDKAVRGEFVQGAPWLQLLAAAAQFVSALPAHTQVMAPLSLDGRCVLCWQPLDDAAQKRMQRFQGHLEGTAVKAQMSAAATVTAAISRVNGIPDALTPEDEAVLNTAPGVLSTVNESLAAIRGRRDAARTLLNTRTPPVSLPALDDAALESLRHATDAVKTDLAALPATDADAQGQLQALERIVLELTTRRSVAESIASVRTFIAMTRERQRLAQAERAINTRAASVKASDLHKKHMTTRYAELVNDELRDLRFRRRRPILAQATNKGTVQVTPLVSAELSHIPAEKVFSEGERTAIALACFLAELSVGDDPSGLIFDDPVSSLDHNVREHLARRLVAAAKTRQVIVFTHDLAFLADLREQAKKIQVVECAFRTLTATDYDAGFVEDEEPFGARAGAKRIKARRPLLAEIERAAKAGEMVAFRLNSKDFYERLRSTWERFIEERLFATVVQRLERNVTAGALSKVAYTPELGEKVHEGWRRCSNALEAHDHAPGAGGQSYSVEDMKADFQWLLDVEAATPKT